MVLKKTFETLKFESKDNLEDVKDRLFFHDLINLTHGISLFLNQKKLQKNSLDEKELDLVIREIKTLQSLARDHFEYTHKNLTDTLKWVPIKMLEANLEHLVAVYFSEKDLVQKTTKISWKIEDYSSGNTYFYFPIFYRVANNIIKNMSEAGTQNVEIKLSFSDQELKLETTNDIRPSQRCLEKTILDESKRPQSLGLDSVDQITRDFGGDFQFEIREGKWINRLILPSQKSSNLQLKKAS